MCSHLTDETFSRNPIDKAVCFLKETKRKLNLEIRPENRNFRQDAEQGSDI